MTRPAALTPAILCTRLSTAGQSDAYGQPSQEADMRLACPAWGLTPAEVVHEVMSGTTDLDKRPEVQEYYRRANLNPGQAFVFPRVDRLGRLAELIIGVARQLIKRKAKVYVVGFRDALDPESPDWLSFQLKSMLSENDHQNIQKRLSDGKFKKAQQGHWPEGKPAYGYTLARDHRGRSTIPDPDAAQFAVYERTVALYESGVGADSIAAKLSREAVPVPREGGLRVAPGWAAKSVLDILKNPAYLGSRTYMSAAGETATITYPPLIDAARWQALQLSIVARRTVRSARSDYPALFAGRLKCSLCGGAQVLQTYAEAGGRRAHYHCRNRVLRANDGRGVTRCENARYHRVGLIDEQGWAALVLALTDPETLRQALASQQAAPPNHAARIAELKRQMSAAVSRTLALDLPDGVLESALRPLQTELARLEAQQLATLPEAVTADVLALAERNAELLSGRDTLEQRRQAVQTWDARLRLGPDGIAGMSLRVMVE